MIPFNLEKFKNGQKALTRDGRVASYIGTCEECTEYETLIFHVKGDNAPNVSSLTGDTFENSEYTLTSMASRHQHLIDNYNTEDTWQYRYNNGIWYTVRSKPVPFDEDAEYRIHPHNNLIKDFKKGAKIEFKYGDNWYDTSNPAFDNEEAVFRVKSKFVYPIYKKCLATNLVVKFTGLSEGEVIESDRNDKPKGYSSNSWFDHTDIHIWEDWTPPEDAKVVTYCLCYSHESLSHKPLIENVTTTVCVTTKDYALQKGYHIIKEWEVHE